MNWVLAHKTLATILGILIILLFTGTIIAVISWSGYQSAVVTTSTHVETGTTPTPTPTPDPLGPYSILLLGHGDPGHDGGSLTDSMILAYIQPRKESIHLISIPRDIWVELPLIKDGKKGYKINAAYAIGKDPRQYPDRAEAFKGEGGGGSLAKYAVSTVTGIQPDYFVAVNFFAFSSAIDAIGGVTVNVPQGFDDPFYPIEEEKHNSCGLTEEDIAALTATLSGDLLIKNFPCRYEHLYFEAGPQEMDGETALKFIRSRHSTQSGNDFARAERQQVLVEAVKKKIVNINFIPKIIPLIQSLSQNIKTDVDSSNLTKLIGDAEELQRYTIHRVVLSESNVLKTGRSSDRQFILQPKNGDITDWTETHTFINQEVERTSNE